MLRSLRESPYDGISPILPHARELVSASLAERTFDPPRPALEWTGDGVHADRWGRMLYVHHAVTPSWRSRRPAEIVDAAVPKLIVIQALRAQSHADVRDWILGCRGEGVAGATIATLIASVARGFGEGEQTWIGYLPERERVRIRWPWDEHTDVFDAALMRGIWRSFFVSSDQPELAVELLRWIDEG